LKYIACPTLVITRVGGSRIILELGTCGQPVGKGRVNEYLDQQFSKIKEWL
jgi:hypothetical protein